MTEVYRRTTEHPLEKDRDKEQVLYELIRACESDGYVAVEVVTDKPWGAMVRFDTENADDFIAAFFPELDPHEARLGRDDMELSPKFLLVTPGERLSWQLHHRRAERWVFLSEGGYYRSSDPDNPGELIVANVGEVVQFSTGECHRLVGIGEDYTLVAEIWQHSDPSHPSDEDDIVRLQDDYRR